MSTEDEPTRRVYRTSLGPVDWTAASEAARQIALGAKSRAGFQLLAALFHTALYGHPKRTAAGDFDRVRSSQLLMRLSAGPTAADVDELEALLSALFERPTSS